MNRHTLSFLFGLWVALCNIPVMANNIDLSTVPPREAVQLTIYNTEDLTLVRDTRTVSVRKGLNPLQFSWANTLIDPTSVTLRFVTQADQLELLNTTFPHDKSQMLYWQVHSDYVGSVQIEISYFTSGIHWQADYTAMANPEETEVQLDSFVRITNHSGEDYDQAQVRLVVGTLHLVENIAQLAQKRPPKREDFVKKRGVEKAMRNIDALQEGQFDNLMMMSAPAAAKQVLKERLSEYFLYTIEGTESIPNGWSKRLRSFKAEAIPLSIQYRYYPQEYGEKLMRFYLLRNDVDSHLGKTPLPNGTIRIFQLNEQKSLKFLAQQSIQYVPIGDKLELNLGHDPSVIFERIPLKAWRDEILFKVRGVEVYRKLDGGFQFDTNSRVAGWNEHRRYTQRICNDTRKSIAVAVRHSYAGDVVFRGAFPAKLHNYNTVEFTAEMEAGEKLDLIHEVSTRKGKNAKKDNVELGAQLTP